MLRFCAVNRNLQIQPARAADAPAIAVILAANRADPSLYARDAEDIRRHIAEFFVVRSDAGSVIGCAGLHAHLPRLAEILSVAVLPSEQGNGAGARLIEACLAAAPRRGFQEIFLVTLKPGYFARFGFRPFSRFRLPAIVLWRKLVKVLQVPPPKMLDAFLGRHTFMRRPAGSVTQ